MSAIKLFDATVTVSQAGTGQNVEGVVVKRAGFAASIIAAAVAGTTPTFDVTIEHSPNNVNWFPLTPAFTQITANSAQSIAIPGPVHRHLRANIVVGGAGPTAALTLFVE